MNLPLPQPIVPVEEKRVRLEYLDGMRGLAALYVVFYHASDPTWAGGTLSGVEAGIRKVCAYGHFAVSVFIILSGYCLMLPVVRSANGTLRGGIPAYLRRRARRILSPYYAALGLSLLLIALVPGLNRQAGNYWDAAIPAFRWDVLMSHLFVVHNLSEAWHFRINPPMWSVATEWQIYFVFPVLIAFWRRFGIIAATLLGFLIGYAPHYLLPAPYNLDVAAPWYVGLFALGMAAAVVNFSRQPRVQAVHARAPWHTVTGLLVGVLGLTIYLAAPSWWAHLWLADAQVGLTTACLIVWCTACLIRDRGERLPLVLRTLQARAPVTLGAFSYSLYLIHAPLLAVCHLILNSLVVSPSMRYALLFVIGIPLVLVFAYGFHLLCERPFMSDAARRGL